MGSYIPGDFHRILGQQLHDLSNSQNTSQGVQNGNWPTPSQIHGSAASGAGISNYGAVAQYYAHALSQHQAQSFADNKPVESAGIKVGEIIAYRIWLIKDGYLESYSAERIWAPEEKMSGKPSDNGMDGIWAFKDKGRAIKKMLETSTSSVYGSVKLWGKVVEHELGYRAEYAKIISLDDISCSFMKKKEILKRLRENYNI